MPPTSDPHLSLWSLREAICPHGLVRLPEITADFLNQGVCDDNVLLETENDAIRTIDVQIKIEAT